MDGKIRWYPVRVPGVCGPKPTMLWLMVTSLTLCCIIFLALELAIEYRTEPNVCTGNCTETGMTSPQANHSKNLRAKRALKVTIAIPVYREEEEVVTVTEGTTVEFSCNPYLHNCPYCARPEYEGTSKAEYGEVYFCKDSCKWKDVKAYSNPAIYGTDDRFEVKKRNRRGNNKDGMTVLMERVKMSDAGTYYCGIDVQGTDWYETFKVVVKKPVPHPVKAVVGPMVEPATETEKAWMGSYGEDGGKGLNEPVKTAMSQCQGNKACTLVVLQKRELEINTSCWMCLQMSHSWRAAPLAVTAWNDTKCLIPLQMTRVLEAGRDIDNGLVPRATSDPNCEASRMNERSGIVLPPLRVVHARGDVCVCHPSRTNVAITGWSDCRLQIETVDKPPYNCTALIKGVRRYFRCPFGSPSDTSPAAIWVCGDRAFHSLPTGGWSGCCYPALMNVGTSVYLPSNDKNEGGRHRRGVSILPGEMPDRYNGYVLFDPWTSIGANVGWSVFLGGGTAVSINKINGLAWSVLVIANKTETALTLINDEMKQIRDAVIQNRMALDILTAERGGLCKLVGVSCCFSLPDYSQNITDIVAHMRMAVQVPKRANSSWLDWLSFKWGDWIYWACTVVAPVLGIGLVILCCLPCIFRFVSWSVSRLVTASTSHQMIRMDVNEGGMNIDMGDDFDYDSNDSDSYVTMEKP
ncbi:uncharacterized protein LOC130230685 [Danio aesculapii]|uniref:uncharacterized protein LOC130230685 n=1 Tax=Danio aesculapii TaxID=1142201 RepID=UPI0024C0B4DD|nr:uncharacterized protein LOC130230685 [Danio aesculapii]